MGMMSLSDLIQGESVVQNLLSFLLVSSVHPDKSHDWLLFCLTLIGQSWSHDLIKLPLQFSTELSSSGGIN